MENKRTLRIASATALVIAVAAPLMYWRSGEKQATVVEGVQIASEGTPAADVDLAAAPARRSRPIPPGDSAKRAVADEKVTDTETPFAFREEINEYSKLKEKVILTDGEIAQKKRLVQDADLIASLADFLKMPTEAPDESGQYDAIDLLFEARKASSVKEVAETVLRSLVEDPVVEDPDMDRETREDMAGLKAEVLFQWTSVDPAKALEVERLLPGPVSRRIWENVQEEQRMNLQESALEARSH